MPYRYICRAFAKTQHLGLHFWYKREFIDHMKLRHFGDWKTFVAVFIKASFQTLHGTVEECYQATFLSAVLQLMKLRSSTKVHQATSPDAATLNG